MAVASAGPYASLHLAPDRQPCQHPTTQIFTSWMPFLPPNQQLQSTEGISNKSAIQLNAKIKKACYWTGRCASSRPCSVPGNVKQHASLKPIVPDCSFLSFVWFCLSVVCLSVIVITTRYICSGNWLWWSIPSASLPLYCFNLQLLIFIVVNKTVYQPNSHNWLRTNPTILLQNTINHYSLFTRAVPAETCRIQ